MKNLKFLVLILTGLFFSSLFNSCKKDDHDHDEEELITTLIMTFTPQAGGSPVIFTFRDLDGDGGNPPEITTAPLSEGTVYTATIQVLNEAEAPTEDITQEILDEANEHQFFFQISSGLNLTFSYTDADANGKPIGLQTTCTTGAASSGTLKVTLRHNPNKNAAGVADGNIANAGGDTDIEVTFDVTVQ